MGDPFLGDPGGTGAPRATIQGSQGACYPGCYNGYELPCGGRDFLADTLASVWFWSVRCRCRCDWRPATNRPRHRCQSRCEMTEVTAPGRGRRRHRVASGSRHHGDETSPRLSWPYSILNCRLSFSAAIAFPESSPIAARPGPLPSGPSPGGTRAARCRDRGLRMLPRSC